MSSGAMDEAGEASWILYEVLEATGRNPGLESPMELWTFVDREYHYPEHMPEKHELDTEDKMYAAFVEMFRGPLFEWRFDVDLGGDPIAPHRFLLNFAVGGTHSLSFAPAKEDSHVLVLSGTVHAGTYGGAISKIERVIDETLGVLRIIGVAYIFEWHRQPEKRPYIRLTQPRLTDPTGKGALNSEYSDILPAIRLTFPADLSELELKQEGQDNVLSRHVRAVRKVLAGSSARASELRSAAAMVFKAERERNAGYALTLSMICLESVLLTSKQGGDISAKLREAVAYSLGRTFVERGELRNLVQELYSARSEFVHRGASNNAWRHREDGLELARRVLRREMDALETDEDNSAKASP
jgi:hypothetical protein